MSNKPQQTRKKYFNSRVTTTFSITLVLFVLGLISLIGIFAKDLTIFVKENIGFTIVLKSDIQTNEVKKLKHLFEKKAYARSFTYISAEDALKELTEELGENPKEFLGFNPLQPSIEVKLHAPYANNDSIAMIRKEVMCVTKNIHEIKYRQDLVSLVNENIRRISFFLLLIAGILLIISFTLINNTVRLSIYSKRFLIHTMKLVGATPHFIRKPFVVANMVNGMIASIFAMAMVYGALYWATTQYQDLAHFFTPDQLGMVFMLIFGLGLFITGLTSFWATNHYLKMKSDDMYMI